MSLLEPPAEKPKKHYVLKITIIAVAIVVIVALGLASATTREESGRPILCRADRRRYRQSLCALEASSTYTMNDFLADWGTNGYYGR